MRIAALDLGSNSVHLVVVEVAASGSFRVVGREKEMVRLGAGTLLRGHLDAATMERALAALSRLKRLAESHGAETLLAAATSAVREAANGEAFLKRAGRELGIWPRPISGEEEGRLIYLAALNSMHLEGQPTLVVDIGGGSMELACGAGAELGWSVSEKLGVLRLTERYLQSDPASPRELTDLQKRVDERLDPHLRRLYGQPPPRVVATSGTALALGELCLAMEGESRPESLHHVPVRAATLRRARKWLVASERKERRGLPALQGRADITVAGAVLLDTLMQRLGADELLLCEWALREGLILDHLRTHPRLVARADACPDVRRRSVAALAERCGADVAHGRQVAALALALFDGTRRHHGLGAAERDLLEHAAFLHDVGHHVSYPRHHRHSYYLIRNGDLRGFNRLEVEVMANVARYHRRARPRKRHGPFRALPAEARRVVKVLAACLRLADALDRSHRQVVRRLSLQRQWGRLHVHCQVDGDCELEVWAAARRAKLLASLLGCEVRVDVARVKGRAAATKRPA